MGTKTKKVPKAATRYALKKIGKARGEYITTDLTTRLQWSHTLGKSVPHGETQAQVDALNKRKFGGFSDWRLPAVEELFCIADRTRMIPAIDPKAFPGTHSDWYWTGTPAAGLEGASWLVNFNFGFSFRFNHYNAGFVRAVRGPVARPGQ